MDFPTLGRIARKGDTRGGASRNSLIRYYVALGERINVSERIQDSECNKDSYPVGLQEAYLMRFIFRETQTCQIVCLAIFGRLFWSIQNIKPLCSVRDSC